METWYLRCDPCRVSKSVVFVVDDPELCPRQPEYRLCPNCGNEMADTNPPDPNAISAAIQQAQEQQVK